MHARLVAPVFSYAHRPEAIAQARHDAQPSESVQPAVWVDIKFINREIRIGQAREGLRSKPGFRYPRVSFRTRPLAFVGVE